MAETGAVSTQFGTEPALGAAVSASRESGDQAAEQGPAIQQAPYKVPVPYPGGYYGPPHPPYMWGPQPAMMAPYGAPGAYYPGYPPPPMPGTAPAYYTTTPPKPPGADGGSGNVSNRRSSGSDSGSSGDDGRGSAGAGGTATYTYGPGGELQWGMGVRRGSASDMAGGPFLDERELKRQRRKQSNRESARRSRLRKQAESEDLGRVKNDLMLENSNLKAEVQRLSERVALLTQDIVALIAQVQGAGLEPVRLASAEGATEPSPAMPAETVAMSIESPTAADPVPSVDKPSQPINAEEGDKGNAAGQESREEEQPKADPPSEAPAAQT